jgi:hypothetical protein
MRQSQDRRGAEIHDAVRLASCTESEKGRLPGLAVLAFPV